MSFAPMLPAGGVLGYRLLTRTEDSQRAVFARQPEITRNIEWFREKIGEVGSAEALLSDRRLLSVALGAFGLDEEIDKRAYLRKVLEEGTEKPEAFANRLVDPRYKAFAAAFGFGDAGGARTGKAGFADGIIAAYKDRQFEIAVGDQDEALRLALNFRREIRKHANSTLSEGSAWFAVMGDKQLRAVLEDAFNLPDSFGQLDIERQREDFRRLNNSVFGDKSLKVFRDDAVVEKAIERFLIRRSIENGPSAATPGYSALTLLGGGIGGTGMRNLIVSGQF
ncbi:MAG: DUF1217 domain-containing protein [Pikeienuella sp.]